MGEILGYEIIPSHPLKYPRSKQGLERRKGARGWLHPSRAAAPLLLYMSDMLLFSLHT
jgi:hypothetical protein